MATEVTVIGFVGWALLFAGMIVLEGLGLTLRGHQWPTISDMFRSATRPPLGRWLLFALWLWTGWHFFIRGWAFFMRGTGAAEPGHGPGGGKSLGQIVSQVVLPLAGLYALLAGMLAVAFRSWKARGNARFAPRLAAARIREQPRAFVRYAVMTIVIGYFVFTGFMGLYELIAGRSAHGVFGSSVVYGAFLAFAVALPLFVALSFAESSLVVRREARRAK